MLEQLERDFVNAWILRQDLDPLAASTDTELAAVAARVAKAYEYPVDSLVLSSTGELLDHLGVNDAFGEGRYEQLLDAAKR